MKIAFIGSGNVGAPLANHLQRLGHEVVVATDRPDSQSVQQLLHINPNIRVAAAKSAVAEAEVVFLATPFTANQEALSAVAEQLKGKIIVDCTNPVGANLSHGLNNVQSGSQQVQQIAADSYVIKAFSVYGFENFEDNAFPQYNVKPAMFFCGDHDASKQVVAQLIEEMGWDPLDVGGLEQSLHLEHMTLMWVRMVRLNGASPHMVWAALYRSDKTQ